MGTELNDLVTMGYIRSAVGVKGWVKLKVDTEYSDSLLDYSEWWLGNPENWQRYQPENSKITADGLQIKFLGVDDRNAAELLRGMTIAIKRQDFAQTDENEYYWVDLIGLKVKTPSDEWLGEVSGLMQSGAHDILIVKGQEKDILIPFVNQFILDVDLEKRQITADWQADYAC